MPEPITRRRFLRNASLAALLAAGIELSPAELFALPPGAARRYLEALDRAMASIERTEISKIDRAARLIADRLVAGRHLYITDDTGALASEGLGRAGGLMLIRGLPGGLEGIQAGDILLLGSRRADNPALADTARRAKESDMALITLSPKGRLSASADIALINHAPPSGGSVEIEGLPAKAGPVSGVLNAVLLWTLTASLIDVLLQRGHKPHIWKSIKLTGAKEFNEAALSETARTRM
ncbi:MAG: hypothetical protein IT210_02630 [Armatimonadetes bacterium]|nr:hypothetical protein [Armatimonadota bacterium]